MSSAIATTLTRRRLLATGMASGLLAGCGESLIGPSQAPLQIYVLRPEFHQFANMPSVGWQLSVARPEVAETLQSQRIALVRGETMDYFADAQWTDSTARLLQSLLVEAFESSGRIAGVAPESEGLRADYTLETEIRDFDARYRDEGAPSAVVALNARLLGTGGHVLGTLEVSHETPASQNAVPAIVAAFSASTTESLSEIVRWTLQTPPRKA